jgi:hypothetical protein
MTDVVTFRVIRPYSTEEEFLEAEAWTINTRSVLLIDIAPHREGLVVRLELTLASGKALIVAEGSVAKHLAASPSRPGGLVVRFRRMSAASSEFVKRAVSAAADRPIVSSALVSSPLSSAVAQSSPRKDTLPPQPAAAEPAPNVQTTRAGSPSVTELAEGLKRAEQLQRDRTRQPNAPSVPPSAGPRSRGARSISVLPPSHRVSSRPPPKAAPRTDALVSHKPETAAGKQSHAEPTPHAGTETRRTGSEALGDENTAPRESPREQHPHHDFDAIARLRQRQGSKPISVPPDREAVLARLKKP